MKVLSFLIVCSGVLSQYATGVMPRVIRLRQAGATRYHLPQNITGYDGAVAVLHCSDIGKTVYLRPRGCTDCQWEKFLVADCASKSDGGYDWMERLGVCAEMDAVSADRWGIPGKIGYCDMAVTTYKYQYDPPGASYTAGTPYRFSPVYTKCFDTAGHQTCLS